MQQRLTLQHALFKLTNRYQAPSIKDNILTKPILILTQLDMRRRFEEE